jgi:imidazoleglycerol-phosphate dehydratase
MEHRRAEYARGTRETDLTVRVDLDGAGETDVETGIGFLDHLLDALGHHAGFDLTVRARGDLEVDDHHTVEDTALALGAALDAALGERAGIGRFGTAHAPLDEALARAVVDLSGRPCARIELGLRRERLGALSTENVSHFLRSLAVTTRGALHVEVLYGENDHHRAEAAFKAVALALRQAVARAGDERVPSTKGTLT